MTFSIMLFTKKKKKEVIYNILVYIIFHQINNNEP